MTTVEIKHVLVIKYLNQILLVQLYIPVLGGKAKSVSTTVHRISG